MLNVRLRTTMAVTGFGLGWILMALPATAANPRAVASRQVRAEPAPVIKGMNFVVAPSDRGAEADTDDPPSVSLDPERWLIAPTSA